MARGGCGPDAGSGHRDGHQQSAQEQYQRGHRIDQQHGKHHQERAGNCQHRGGKPTRKQAVQGLDSIDHSSGQFAGVLHAELRRSGMQKAGQGVGAQTAPSRRAGTECSAIAGNGKRGTQQRQ